MPVVLENNNKGWKSDWQDGAWMLREGVLFQGKGWREEEKWGAAFSNTCTCSHWY